MQKPFHDALARAPCRYLSQWTSVGDHESQADGKAVWKAYL